MFELNRCVCLVWHGAMMPEFFPMAYFLAESVKRIVISDLMRIRVLIGILAIDVVISAF